MTSGRCSIQFNTISGSESWKVVTGSRIVFWCTGAHFGRERSPKKDMSPQLGFIPEEYILHVSPLNDEQSLVSSMIVLEKVEMERILGVNDP